MEISAAGQAILVAALACAVWSTLSSGLSVKGNDRRLALSGERALFATGFLILCATVLLVYAFYTRDFSLVYVHGYSSRSTSPVYTLTALWAGMEGSLLFWTLLSALYAVSAIAVQRKRRPDLTPVATGTLAGIIAFFIAVLVFGANPFDALSPIPGDGAGLNPLLQSPFMAIHPAMLYLGLTGFAVPFAFAVASLVTGRLEAGWFTSTRRWTVLAWSFLTVGIILGGAWAYMELGWGGYWAWDPVENASLLPWLTGTAFLHSVMIQERRQMLKIWNVALILGTYCLAIFGTFLTRSGLLSSVHTFSESPVGKMFLPFLAVMLVFAFGLLGWRYEKLRSERHLESMFSREAMFLFNNLLLVTIALTVLWGTLYPIMVEAVSGAKISVGPPFFNTVVGPMGLALLALTGIGPLVAWRRASWRSLKRELFLPLVAGFATVAALGFNGVRSAGAMFGLGLTSFVAVATIGEFARGARAHRGKGLLGYPRGLVTVISGNRRRYGGYIVHLGVVLICLGISGTAFRQSWSGDMLPGDSFTIGRYEVTYERARTFTTDEKAVRMAVMAISQDGRPVRSLTPQRNIHLAQDQPQSEVGLRTTLSDDLYLVLTQMDSTFAVTMRAWVNPLVAWIWIGGVFMALGMLVILSGKPPTQRGVSPGSGRAEKPVPVSV
ncbi:MAG TPA: heme lyase CcmF/NrfE family subunit [Actinomycetota bacterium]|nr:heme lyase CcmF/NrfE family subunit [Actinomycetota bacterium]